MRTKVWFKNMIGNTNKKQNCTYIRLEFVMALNMKIRFFWGCEAM